MKKTNAETDQVRELFIEELEQVTGGGGPDYKKTLQWPADQLQTTYACGEEGPPC